MDFCDRKCEYTVNEQDLNQSDAVVFHGRDTYAHKYLINVSVLNRIISNKSIYSRVTNFPTHLPHQRWVFLMFESPDNSWTNISEWNNIFDWTMSYRRDSDVFIPYGELMPISGQSERIVLSANIRLVAYCQSGSHLGLSLDYFGPIWYFR